MHFNSLVDYDSILFATKILEKYPNKIILPIDSVNGLEISNDTSVRTCMINEFKEDEIGLDVGDKTIDLFKKYIDKSKTIIWNGPLGYFELDKFSNGTKNMCEILKNSNSDVIIGGGDTGAAAINF